MTPSVPFRVALPLHSTSFSAIDHKLQIVFRRIRTKKRNVKARSMPCMSAVIYSISEPVMMQKQ